MKTLSMLFVLAISLFSNDGVHDFTPSSECKECHTQIYSEFYGSMHANATPSQDSIHKAVWDKHPANTKNSRYQCGKCHTPAANNLDKMLTKGEKAMPDAKNATHQEAISCAYCHRIEGIKKHPKSNTNIINKIPNSYYGTSKIGPDSPYHKIMTEGNEHMQNGNVCIGCHSHKMNKNKLNVCSTNIANEMDGANCVSCHMPEVKGSMSSISDTRTHSFHGFPGTHYNSDMLTKYVDISILKNINNFIVNIDNRSSHALLLHPLRVGILKISVNRAHETIKLEKEVFVRVIGKDGKPTMPWIADTIIKDTMIKANEKRAIKRDFKILKGDRVDVVLGWFLVNPKALKKLGLQKEKAATKFHIFKKQSFTF
ncbi:MAG: cytochrome c family protein [Sulfurimonas sp.]|nr:cytochrome c family protein [Sulfurimonas sp.]